MGSIVASAAMARTASFMARRAALCCSISRSSIRAGRARALGHPAHRRIGLWSQERVERGDRALPGELACALGAGGFERVVTHGSHHLVGDLVLVARIGIARRVAARLGKGPGAGRDDGDAARHGFEAGEAEALVEGGQDEGLGARVETG